MTNRIQHIITEIRSKQNDLMNMLQAEKEKNAQSLEKIEELEKKLHEMEQENSKISTKNATLHAEIETLKVTNEQLISNAGSEVQNSVQRSVDHVQIDELVREIEYCIGQLKNNA